MILGLIVAIKGIHGFERSIRLLKLFKVKAVIAVYGIRYKVVLTKGPVYDPSI